MEDFFLPVQEVPVFAQQGSSTLSQLGLLYDCRQAKVIEDSFFWSPETISSFKTEKLFNVSSTSEIYHTESWIQNLKSQGVFEQLKLSVFSGLDNLAEHPTFLKKSEEFQKSINLIIVLEKVTKIEKISPSLLKCCNFSDLLSNNNASHIIVGVKYGWRTIINIDLKRDHDKETGLNELNAFVKKILSSAEIEKYSNSELQMAKKVKWKINYGGVETVSSEFEDILKLCNKFDKGTEAKEAPTTVFLVSMPNILYQSVDTNFSLTKKFNNADYIFDTIVKLNDLCKLPCLVSFPLFKQEIVRCVKILGKKISESDIIIKILKTSSVPSLSLQLFLEKWLNKTNDIAAFLSKTLKLFTNINIGSTNKEILNGKKDIIFILAINTIITNDTFIQELQSYKSHNVISKTSYISSNSETFSVAFETAKSFNKFAIANKDRKGLAFFCTEDISLQGKNENSSPIEIKLFKNGIQQTCPTLPTKPENFTIKEISCETVSITWNKPKKGAEYVTRYLITAKENDSSIREWSQKANNNDAMQLTLEKLSCNSTYCIILQGVTNFGVTPSQQTKITTLSADLPKNMRLSVFNKNTSPSFEEIIAKVKHMLKKMYFVLKQENEKLVTFNEVNGITINLLKMLKLHKNISIADLFESIFCQYGYNSETKSFERPDSDSFLKMLDNINFALDKLKDENMFEEVLENRILSALQELSLYPNLSYQENALLQKSWCPIETTSDNNKFVIAEKKDNFKIINKKLPFVMPKPLKKTKSKSNHSYSDFFEKDPAHKYHMEDVFSVDIFNFNDTNETEKQLKFLRQLLSLDFHCRDQTRSQCAKKTSIQECNDEDDFFAQVTKKNSSPQQSRKENSSTDLIQKTLFNCDDFLLQDVFEKMTSCQLAVPILTSRDSNFFFNLWGMRTVKKKWVTAIPKQVAHDEFISGAQMGTISFCRIGENKLSLSKSILANLFLSSAQGWPEHSYFLHRGIDSVQKLNRGCIEACWYCPEGRPREHLKDIHAIYNLRGDVRDNMKQFKFLLSVSYVLVIIIENTALNEEEIDSLKFFDGWVILINLAQEGISTTKNKKVCLYAQNINQNILSQTLIEYIPPVSQKLNSLENQADLALSFGFLIDEMNVDCKTGKKAAEEFINQIKKYDLDSLKSFVVPLQGSDWIEWATIDKEESRHQYRGDADPQQYSSKLRDKKKQLRKSQLKKGLSQEIEFFLKKMLQFRNTCIQRYFIQWCQIELNAMSEKYLPKILSDFNSSAKQLSSLIKQLETQKKCSKDNMNENVMQQLITEEKKKINILSEKFKNASFGIENIFREMGQVYESYEEENQNKIVSDLPILMAELFLIGYPLEIMDGDAVHVPLVWIQKVFMEVKKKIGNVNVFVLSILGIQSSGKSTFLNTMFGSKFAVSSGRCTKGVFIQLVSVSQNLRQKMNCDYFIIMDSEGLRSPEMTDSFRHDNEIATLVTCLANATIINFWGQTFSKEMSDIVQIAAHAYIRMKKIEIKSSFHMIFAGVPDINAKEKNRLGVKKILDELNIMILKIANDEGRIDILSGLSSIFPLIHEQLDKLDFPEFFPALWQGSMNTPEPRYGEIVQELKNSICDALIKYQNTTLRTQPIQEFIARLSDIWEAIKQENFVFGFKNSHAIIVFGEVQRLYDKELAQLRKSFYELSYQVAEEFFQENTELKNEYEGFRIYNRKFEQQVLPKIELLQEKVKENLRAHVFKMPDPDLAATHLSTFFVDMTKKVTIWLEKEKEIKNEKINSICQNEKITPIKRQQYRKKCLMEARKIASDLKNKSGISIDKTIVIKEFENMFQQWMLEACNYDKNSYKSLDSLYVKTWYDSLNILTQKLHLLHPKSDLELFNKVDSYFNSIKKIEENDEKSLFNIHLTSQSDITLTSCRIKQIYKNFVKQDWHNDLKEANSKLNLIIEKVKSIIKDSREKSATNFSYSEVIADILHQSHEDILKPLSNNFEFSKAFKFEFLIKIFGASVKKMALLRQEHSKIHSYAKYLDNQKSDLFNEFQTECHAADSDARAGERFINFTFCKIIENQVKLSIGPLVFDSIICRPQFNMKNEMMYYILKELIKAPYSQVQSFINDYNTYVKNWIKKEVTKHCLKNNFLTNCINNKIKSIVLLISDILRNIETSAIHTNPKSWWEAVNEKMKAKEILYQLPLNDVISELESINNFPYTLKTMIKSLNQPSFEIYVLKQILQSSTEMNISDSDDEKDSLLAQRLLNWFVVNPLTALQEQRIGCTAQCPFCGAVCSGGVACQAEGSRNQKHRAEIHMPQGINQYRWKDTNDPNKENTLVSDICTSLVTSKAAFKMNNKNNIKYGIEHDNYIPYSTVNDLIYDWHYNSVPKASATAFWQYLFVKYQSEFAKNHNAKEAIDIPSGWRLVTVKDAKKNLREIHTIQEASSDSENDL
nr:interferon-induced very large GTPase 1-like isoform X2 [Hydra vulgaris]